MDPRNKQLIEALLRRAGITLEELSAALSKSGDDSDPAFLEAMCRRAGLTIEEARRLAALDSTKSDEPTKE